MPGEKISVVVPVYNEEEVLPLFFAELTRVADEMTGDNQNLDFEFIFVDDGSKDKSLDTIRAFASADARVRYISFSRNFGKEAAMYAGLEYSAGDYAAVMDADLQHPPELLPRMYGCVSSGEYDCAAARRTTRRGEPLLLSFFSRCFYKVINKVSRVKIADGVQDFRLLSRRAVVAVLSVKEYNRFSKGIFAWVGFNTAYIDHENAPRAAGRTTWSFWKLLLYSLEGLMAFSAAPLAAASLLGAVFCAAALVLSAALLINTLAQGGTAAGWSAVVCAVLLTGGVQLLCIGILGQYLEKTYLETKSRPLYIVKETEQTLKKEGESGL